MRNVVLTSSVAFAIAGILACSGAPSDDSSVGRASVSSAITASPPATTGAATSAICHSVGAVTPPPPTNGHSMKTIDLNRDGVLDVIFGNTNEIVLTVLLGLPGGGFGPQASVGIGVADEAEEFDAGDVNGDGVPDLVVAKGYDFNTVAVLLGKGDGTFGAPVELTVDLHGFAGPDAVRIADFNGDGHADFATENVDENTVSVLLGDGRGHFGAPVLSTFGTISIGSLDAADLNRDGILDLVMTTGYALGRGDGSFQAQKAWPLDYFDAVVVGDFNGDNVPDVAGTRLIFVGKNQTEENELDLLIGKGDGTFAAAKALTTGPFTDVSHDLFAGDVDRDGHTDIVVELSGATVFFGAGDGTFPRTQNLGFDASVVAGAPEGAGSRIVLFATALDSFHCGS